MIGIILLLSASIFLFVHSKAAVKPLSESASASATQAQFSQDPLSNFVSSCLIKTAQEGLKLAALQGGYAYPEGAGITANQEPTAGRAVLFPDKNGKPVAYWHYLASPNNCVKRGSCAFSSEKPYLHKSDGSPSVERQVEIYVERNIGSCVGDFSQFTKQGWIVEFQQPVATATFVGSAVGSAGGTAGSSVGAGSAAASPDSARVGTSGAGAAGSAGAAAGDNSDNSLVLSLQFPLVARFGDSELKLKSFSGSVDTSFPRMYGLASEITEIEQNNSFLELHTMNLIGAYSGIDAQLPPISAVKFDPGTPKFWIAENVKKTLKDVLVAYTSGLRVEDTANYRQVLVENPVSQGLYDQMVLTSDGIHTERNDFGVYFSYLSWPYYLSLNRGQTVVGPEQADSLMGIFTLAIKKYSTAYDVSYPVVVSVTNKDEDITLNFGLEVNVRANEALESNTTELPISSITIGSLLFSPTNPRVNVTVVAHDDISNEPIGGVAVGFRSGREFGLIGETDYKPVIMQFPAGAVGQAVFTGDGFITTSVPFAITDAYADTNTGANNRKELNVELPYIRNPIVKAVKIVRKKTAQGWVLDPAPVQLAGNETASIILERIPDKGQDQFVTYAEVSGIDAAELSNGLAPGKYKVTINLKKNEALYIPPTEKCPPKILGLIQAAKCVTIPNQTIEAPVIIGGASFDEEPMSFLGQVIDKYGTITFVTLATGIFETDVSQRSIDDFAELAPSEELSKSYRTKLMPRYSNDALELEVTQS